MRFMILVKATPDTEAGVMPEQAAFTAMAEYHEALAQAGVLLDANGLRASARGWRIRYEGGRRSVIDGPFAESKELIAGYTLIQTRSREEALEWSRRFPRPHPGDCEIEVREVFEAEDFAALEGEERFCDLGVSSGGTSGVAGNPSPPKPSGPAQRAVRSEGLRGSAAQAGPPHPLEGEGLTATRVRSGGEPPW